MEVIEFANRAIRRVMIVQGVRSEVRSVLGHRVHFYRVKGEGRGPPVLMVHGLGSSANAYSQTMLPLARHFREVWALDLPGNGFSPLPAAGPLAVRDHVKVVLEFQQDLIGEPVFLIGNSLGGALSLFAAVEAPSAVRALGLLAPAGARMSPERIAALKRSFDVQNNAEARAMTRRLFARPPLPILLFAGELKNLYGAPAVRAILGEVQASDHLTEAQLQGLAMPTLLLWGTREKVLPYEGVHYFRANLPAHAEVHEVEGFGHMPQLEHPGETVARLLSFAEKRGLIAGRS